MRKAVAFTVVVFVLGLTSLWAADTAQPQTKCEQGFVNVQFKGDPAWYPTPKKCAAKPKLDTTYAGKNLSPEQLDALLQAFLSGQSPTPQQREVCCCQPGFRVYDNATQSCSQGVLRNKNGTK